MKLIIFLLSRAHLIKFTLASGCNACLVERQRLAKLRPYGHRVCFTCVRQLIAPTCPKCRGNIATYMPKEQMGGERWHESIPQLLDEQFAAQMSAEFVESLRQEWYSRVEDRLKWIRPMFCWNFCIFFFWFEFFFGFLVVRAQMHLELSKIKNFISLLYSASIAQNTSKILLCKKKNLT